MRLRSFGRNIKANAEDDFIDVEMTRHYGVMGGAEHFGHLA